VQTTTTQPEGEPRPRARELSVLTAISTELANGTLATVTVDSAARALYSLFLSECLHARPSLGMRDKAV
jgi:hypothetical protein